jgi:hypothetical protein
MRYRVLGVLNYVVSGWEFLYLFVSSTELMHHFPSLFWLQLLTLPVLIFSHLIFNLILAQKLVWHSNAFDIKKYALISLIELVITLLLVLVLHFLSVWPIYYGRQNGGFATSTQPCPGCID